MRALSSHASWAAAFFGLVACSHRDALVTAKPTTIPTSSFPLVAATVANTDAQAFTTPGTNSGGQNDWLLVLDVTFG
jgi:hypothetical protein